MCKPKSLIVIAVFVLIALASPARAANGSQQSETNPFHLPNEWLVCAASGECGKVMNNCGYTLTASQKAHTQDAYNQICGHQNTSSILCQTGCAHNEPIKNDSKEAVCNSGHCMLRTKAP